MFSARQILNWFLGSYTPSFYRFEVFENEDNEVYSVIVSKVENFEIDYPIVHFLEFQKVLCDIESFEEAFLFAQRLYKEGCHITIAYMEPPIKELPDE